MLVFDEWYVFANKVAEAFAALNPDIDGTLAPYHGQSYESEGLTITVKDAVTETIYRLSLLVTPSCVRDDGSVLSYRVKLSQRKSHSNITNYHSFAHIAKLDHVLKENVSEVDDIAAIVKNMQDLLNLVKFTPKKVDKNI